MIKLIQKFLSGLTQYKCFNLFIQFYFRESLPPWKVSVQIDADAPVNPREHHDDAWPPDPILKRSLTFLLRRDPYKRDGEKEKVELMHKKTLFPRLKKSYPTGKGIQAH
jgi:hypothetical protein